MTVLLEGNHSIIFSAAATFIDENMEQASRWASKYIIPNKALKYIAAQYVEADKPNNNGQMWTHRDLSISRPTIVNSPMNLLHQSRRIVGTWVANEMLYPTEAAAEGEQANPYIEVLGAYWKYYFPEELAYVEDSHRDGKLFVSMECVAETVTFRDGEREETYPYMGAVSEAYGDIAKQPGVTRQLNSPHFLGGALVFPPYSPGWKNAKVLELAGEQIGTSRVEDTFAQVRSQNPHLSEGEVESLVAGTIGLGYREIAAAAMDSEESIAVNVPSIQKDSIKSQDQSLLDSESETPEEGVTMKTFTEDELNEAIAKATAPLEAELAELKGASALESKVAEISAEYDAKIETLKAELDAAVLAAEGAKAEHAQLVEYLEATAAAEAAEREAAARKAERIAKVEEVASFPSDYIEKRADEWASMSDEAFESLVHDYAAVSTAAKGSAVATQVESDDSIPAETAMHNEQKVESADRMASIREVMRLSLSGTTLKNL